MDQDDFRTLRTTVYSLVKQVPRGQVTTYGQIGRMIPPPGDTPPPLFAKQRARLVGRAMRDAPSDVPWHRVINSQGKISLPLGSRGAAVQRKRLEAEGIIFDRFGRVDLDRFGWQGPDQQWGDANGLLRSESAENHQPRQLDLFT